MQHLVHMASFSAQTNMHARNLAIVWAPNLLRWARVCAVVGGPAQCLLSKCPASVGELACLSLPLEPGRQGDTLRFGTYVTYVVSEVEMGLRACREKDMFLGRIWMGKCGGGENDSTLPQV